MKKIKVRISRSKWSRGDCRDANALLVTHGDTKLNKHFKTGNMCCLGFAALALGAKESDIRDKSMPGEVLKDLPGLNTNISFDNYDSTPFSGYASEINDAIITDKVREKKLRKLAEEHGFKFVFVP